MTIITIMQISWNFVNESKPFHLGPLKTKAYTINGARTLYICTNCHSAYATTKLPITHEYYFCYNFIKYSLKYLVFPVNIISVIFVSKMFTSNICFVMGPFCSWLPARQALAESKLNTKESNINKMVLRKNIERM